MPFAVFFHDEFMREFDALNRDVQIAITKGVKALAVGGHDLGRLWVDTLKGSAFPNTKELRATSNRIEWRVAFAFDPIRNAILLAAVSKGGKKDSRTYADLIRVADARFAAHLATIEKGKET